MIFLNPYLLLLTCQTILASPIIDGELKPPRLNGSAASKKSLDSLMPRAAYGEPVSIEEFPYFASLDVCGAVILSDRWVLTAAHCVTRFSTKILYVGANKTSDCKQISYVKAFLHPYYHEDKYAFYNDIAVLRLAKPLAFGHNINSVSLPDIKDSVKYQRSVQRHIQSSEIDLRVSSDYIDWSGSDRNDDEFDNDHSQENICNYSDEQSDELSHDKTTELSDEPCDEQNQEFSYDEDDEMVYNKNVLISRGVDETGKVVEQISKINIFAVPASICFKDVYNCKIGNTKFYSKLDKAAICGVRVEDKPGAGFGDSGSPLVDENNTLVGIVSFGRNERVLPQDTCIHKVVAFYVNIASYVPWIKLVTGL